MIYFPCALAKGNSACGQKEAKPCGTLVHTVAQGRAAKSQWKEERLELAACACHSGGYRAVKRR